MRGPLVLLKYRRTQCRSIPNSGSSNSWPKIRLPQQQAPPTGRYRIPYQHRTKFVSCSATRSPASLGRKWIDSIMVREARKANRYDENGKLIYRPEDRMRENAVVGALLHPAGLIWYGWTVDKGVFWLASMILNFFFGVGSMLIFAVVTTMLTEFLPKRSSEGVALSTFVRNIFSCVGSFVTVPIINGIGNGWMFTIVGLIVIASSGVIIAMRVFGRRWRNRMDSLLQ
ncbi:hypothetical protein BJY00DRAFT_276851 [Aspergillus carlsbadensis]|nr:hypothetical protein BJY00DRAFT_276851 [Aspergillus carlsbadensis]